MIKTSVIIPVYNTAEYLQECLDSVLAQTQKEIEIIIVDDGSDDGSYEMAQDYEKRYACVCVIRQNHEYQGTARNRGLRMARGQYVYFMDSDDAILPDLFARCYEECEKRELDFVMFDAQGFRYDENDRELIVPDDIIDRRPLGIEDRLYTGPEYWNTFYNVHGLLYVCWLLYIRRDYLLEHDLFNEERTYFEDNDWMLRMYLNAQRIYYIPEIFHRHRWRRGSNMLDGFTVGLMEGCFRMHWVLLKILGQYRGDEERTPMIEDVIRLNLRRFDRLAEVQPRPEYTKPLAQFCDDLRAQLKSRENDEKTHYIHLAAAMRILRAAGTWEDKTFCEAYRDLTGSASILHAPEAAGGSVGVYGTGVVGRRYAELLRECAPESAGSIFFIDTWKDGGEICGFPVVCADRLPELKPDAVVIASTKYAGEMTAEVQKRWKQARIVCLPDEIRYLI